jgi:hypothetical protein
MASLTTEYLKAIQSERTQPDKTFASAFLEILDELAGMRRAMTHLIKMVEGMNRDDEESDED